MKCQGKLADGSPCKYSGKPQYGGFCGIHANPATAASVPGPPSDSEDAGQSLDTEEPNREFRAESDREDESKELAELERQILEQEHRPIAAIRKFIVLRPTYPKGDPRRRAITFSLLWSLFFSPGGVAIIGSVVAIASIAMLAWQNSLMRHANELILEQIQAEERVALQAQRLEAMRDLYGQQPAALRSEALLTLTTISRRLLELAPENTHLVRRDLTSANLEGCNLDYKKIEGFNLADSNLQDASIEAGVLQNCLLDRIALSGARFNCHIEACSFDEVSFAGVDLAGTTFVECTFYKADFEALECADVRFTDCRFEESNIPPGSSLLTDASFLGRNLFVRISSLTDAQKAAHLGNSALAFSEENDWK